MAASTRQNPNFILSPHQQNLLFAALNSNKGPVIGTNPSVDPISMAPMAFTESPQQQAPGSGTLNGFEDSPFIDYDYDFDPEGGSFDYSFDENSQGQMIGNLPGTSSDGEGESHDKRSHPDDDDDNEEEGGGKRREGEDKGSKKPGRKPLTSEPTSKRKAQNRAAQRAFRERKEKHLKDLETKVQDLEKASESANHENSILRAQVERMSVELREYKKKLASPNNRSSPPLSGGLPPHLSGKAVNNPSEINFQFEFPRFGKLPGPPVLNGSSFSSSAASPPPAPTHRASSSSINGNISPFDQTLQPTASLGSFGNGDFFQNNQSSNNDAGDMSAFSGLFTPSIISNADKAFNFDVSTNYGSTASRSSTESSRGHNSTGHNTTYSSPSASSNVGSTVGLSSSCGTSPEPLTQSPAAFKSNENTLSTIGEEKTIVNGNEGNIQTPEFDLNGIDFWAQQNGNQFDPQLFGDYREPQNNILTGGLYDDSFFTEAFALPEFNSPSAFEQSPAPKKDLVAEIDQKLNEDDEVVPGEPQKMLTCNTMWEKIQACPKVQSGEVDMDSLCSELQRKAKCSGDGPVINEKDFADVIHSVLKKEPATNQTHS